MTRNRAPRPERPYMLPISELCYTKNVEDVNKIMTKTKDIIKRLRARMKKDKESLLVHKARLYTAKTNKDKDRERNEKKAVKSLEAKIPLFYKKLKEAKAFEVATHRIGCQMGFCQLFKYKYRMLTHTILGIQIPGTKAETLLRIKCL